MKYSVTNDSVSVVLDGQVFSARVGMANYAALRAAVLAGDEGAARKSRSVGKAIEEWARAPFKVVDGNLFHGTVQLPESLTRRIMATAEEGHSPEALLKFWERLSHNPSARSVEQLYPFLEHEHIPLDSNGYILAYKGVTYALKDCHTGKFDNSPGMIHEMPRNQISDDPNKGCHYGFHVGSEAYATNFGSRTVIVKVDPADVVCIPYDHSHQKMRVCKYEVVGHYTGPMPSTLIDPQEIPENLPEDEGDEGAVTPEPSLGVKVASRWKRVHSLGSNGLLNESIDYLRKYAVHGLKMVGVYRLPGGKPGLIRKIVEFRGEGV